MNIDLTVLISVTSTILGVIVMIYKLKKTEDESLKSRTLQESALSNKLDYILENIKDLKNDLKDYQNKYHKLSNEFIILKETNKNLIVKVDEISKRLDDFERGD